MKRLKFGILKCRNFKSVFKISSAGIPQQKSTKSQMSLKKKDPSLRVAANDPHLVSLGGGRLSTAVTIHYIPIGDTTIGCSTTCSISLNGTGVRPTHCTIYRSEENEVTIVPEHDARILIDGSKVTQETNLTQGAMITIGNSNYLRFNNPAEAQMMRSAMGSNERISMPQIDFSQVPTQQHSSTKRIGGGGSSSNASANNDAMLRQSIEIERFYEMKINPNIENPCSVADSKVNYNSIDINGLHCPKVFTADLVTVNMPAKDVLGQKYANFARNLAENHRNIDKNSNNALRNNQMSNLKTSSAASSSNSSSITSGALGAAPLNGSSSNYVNIPNSTNYIQNAAGSTEYLTKVNNVNHSVRATNTNAYDRYPKPGTYGGLQIYPMNGVNTEINNCSANSSPHHQKANNFAAAPTNQQHKTPHLSNSEHERLEDMLKICTEYADRQLQQQNQIQNSAQSQSQSQNNSITSSPIVQNRIKTNGSLPRDKKSPFHQHDLGVSGTQQPHQALSNSSSSLASNHAKQLTTSSFSPSSPCSTGYENVRLIGQNRVEINGQVATSSSSPKTGYENIGKYVPQSPRTKIRTTCMSPKKHSEHATFSSTFGQSQSQPQVSHKSAAAKQKEYEQLIKTFEEKLELEMQAIEESSRYQPVGAASLQNSPSRRTNKNINNLTLNLQTSNSLQNSPRLSKKPAPAPRHMSNACSSGLNSNSNSSSNNSSRSNLQRPPPTTAASMCSKEELESSDVEKLLLKRKDCLIRIERLKRDISDLQKQENEALRELDLEKALVSAELNSVGDTVESFEQQLQLVQNKIHRMEAQRNAARVMEENQQAKLKQSIEMKQDQVKKLKIMLKQKPNNDCLKEELHNVAESLENDRKTFEDLEFQYLEEESEWQAYREDLHAEEAELSAKIAAQRLELKHLEKQEKTNQTNASSDARTLKQNLLSLLNELKQCQEHLKTLETGISDVTGQLNVNSSEDEDFENASGSTASPPMQQLMQSTSLAAGGVMSQSLFGSTELLCPKRSTDDIMSKSVNENMFYNNKIEVPSSTPKRRPPLQVVDICSEAALVENEETEDGSGGGEVAVGVALPQNERVKFNLSLGSDDFEVNPLEKRVPSQDDIDRICKVTLDAPISTKGASTKIFDSIKEIERNRQLLLAQQGHHVIEHERQKMQDLKKKSHDEARAQYLSMLNCSLDGSSSSTSTFATKPLKQQQQLPQHEQMQEEAEESRLIRENGKISDDSIIATDAETQNSQATHRENNTNDHIKEQSSINENSSGFSTKHRHSQPELDHQNHHQQQMQQHHRNSRPLSESNSELSCADLLSENKQNCKSNLELGTNASGTSSLRGSTAGNRKSGEQNTSSDDGAVAAAAAIKRSSVNSNETTSLSSERKRAPLPKHQRPLTRYLPIFSPDLNLRHHIESAGHQIALCPHVFVDAYSCRGYLHKLGATFHGWARRWFVLDRQRNALIYFSDKSERKPRGGAYFSTIDEVYLDHLNASKSGRPHCTFIVKTKKRSYQLQAASDATARIWIDAIITGAQGNLDY